MRTYLLLLIGCSLYHKADAQTSSPTDSILLYTQQLLDGVTTGDTGVWKKYLDDSCIITPENGGTESKEAFLKQLRKPPAPYLMTEVIERPIFRVYEGTIIFSYVASVSLNVLDQRWKNDICQTDTWLKTANGWKMISTAAFMRPANPIPRIPDSNIVKYLIGEYLLDKQYACSIYEKDGRLYSKRTGRDEIELTCESDYVFMTPNPLIRLVFSHDSNGNVMSLLYRRSGSDLTFNKVK
jgi:Domain of unknown function (DUF4440)